jgi:tetratricopeptide (TPR) repeat protein
LQPHFVLLCQICKVAKDFIEKLQASFALCGLNCPALDVIHCSAKFNQAGCFSSECPAMQDLDMQWIQNLASAMSASKLSSAQSLGEARPTPVSPALTVTQLANMRRFSGNHSHAASILSSALQHCESGTSDFSNPAHKCALHHNLGDLLRERLQYEECKTQLDRADSCFPANFLNDFEAFLVASALDRERLLQESDAKRGMFAEIAAVMATRARLLENQNLLEEAEKLFHKSLNALRVSSKLFESCFV